MHYDFSKTIHRNDNLIIRLLFHTEIYLKEKKKEIGREKGESSNAVHYRFSIN